MEYNEESNLTELLPSLRCTPEMRAALQQIARKSVARNISDHMRLAVQRYISEEMDNAENTTQRERVPA